VKIDQPDCTRENNDTTKKEDATDTKLAGSRHI
jgi:hypothetical protein